MKPFNTLTPQPHHTSQHHPDTNTRIHPSLDCRNLTMWKYALFIISNVTFFVVSDPPIPFTSQKYAKQKDEASEKHEIPFSLANKQQLSSMTGELVADYIHHAGSRDVTLCHVMSRGSCSLVPPSAPHYTMLHSIRTTTAPVSADANTDWI